MHLWQHVQLHLPLPRLFGRHAVELLKRPGESRGRFIAVFIADVHHLHVRAFQVIPGQGHLPRADILCKTDAAGVGKHPLEKGIGTSGQRLHLLRVDGLLLALQTLFRIVDDGLQPPVPFHTPAPSCHFPHCTMGDPAFPLIFCTDRIDMQKQPSAIFRPGGPFSGLGRGDQFLLSRNKETLSLARQRGKAFSSFRAARRHQREADAVEPL